LEPRKRAKTSVSAEPDMNRKVRSIKAFSEENGGILKIIHAADIASLKSSEYEPALRASPKQMQQLLQYPSASKPERYGTIYTFNLYRALSKLMIALDTSW
jgi:[histone H3]-lysine79 N-trimethyltransferase